MQVVLLDMLVLNLKVLNDIKMQFIDRAAAL